MSFPIAATTAANAASNGATRSRNDAPHRKNAAQRNRSDSPYQGRTAQKDNPTQLIIKQAVDFLIRQVEAGKSETLAAYLTAMARFHKYSFGNIVAIARQKPDATRVAGFGTWKEMGRYVRRGEKGIQILAPMIGFRRRNAEAAQDTDADGNTKQPPVLIGFRAVYVFDVAQTEGEDLPEFEHSISGEVGEQRDRLIDFLAQQNITLEFNGGTRGQTERSRVPPRCRNSGDKGRGHPARTNAGPSTPMARWREPSPLRMTQLHWQGGALAQGRLSTPMAR